VRRLIRSFVPCLLLAGAVNAWSADGRILSFEGDVRVNGQAVSNATVLNRRDTIVTAAGASVKIMLSDNSVLDIDSESEVQLSDYSYSSAQPEKNKSEIGVVEGTLRYVSGLIAKEDPDDVGFTAGNSTIGVRGSFTAIEVDGVTVNVEAMIGEATLSQEQVDGQKHTVVVPTGQTTQKDPVTGKILVTPSTVTNAVNAVVYAIAAAAPDSPGRSPQDEGCSEGAKPLRNVARPAYDETAATAISDQLADLSKGDLMLVIAVLLNNQAHLCIDSATVANAIGVIATVRPEVAAEVVYVASVIDPKNSDDFKDTATAAAPNETKNIEDAEEEATGGRGNAPGGPRGSTNPISEVPPGGPDPSPE
jgi:hypothetical protein